MKIQELTEAKLIRIPDPMDASRGYNIYINPTGREIASILPHTVKHSMRAIYTSKDIYVWDSYWSTHEDVAERIGVVVDWAPLLISSGSGSDEAPGYTPLKSSSRSNSRYGFNVFGHTWGIPSHIEKLIGYDKSLVAESIVLENRPRTLYHGTLRKFAQSILQHGLEPRVGDLVEMGYDEYIQAGENPPELVFAADKQGLDACLSAILFLIGRHYQRSKNVEEDVRRYGALVVIKDENDMFDRRKDGDLEGLDDHPVQVEPGDYYSYIRIKPSFIMVGDRLVNFFRRYRRDFDPGELFFTGGKRENRGNR